ncbi:MAG: SDR family oxidoreductase [Chloroflexi bacterium]|nr:SDR family oxidoreductase [Chloroflexota bacterium]
MFFQGKVALVTGAGSGIGRACALELAKQGASIAVLDKDAASAQETAKLVAAVGSARAYACDITRRPEVDRAIGQVIADLHRVDVLVNNAGKGASGPFLEHADAQIEEMLDVNLKGHIYVSQAVVKQMAQRKYGRIVFISSSSGTMGEASASLYSSAKGALISLAKSLAKEHGKQGITVNCIAPGPVDSPMFQRFQQRDPEKAKAFFERIPMKRPAKVEEVAAAVAFLASDAAAYVTGVTLSVDGGLTMAP